MKLTHMTVLGAVVLLAVSMASAEPSHDPTRPATLPSNAKASHVNGAPLQLEAVLRSGGWHLAIVNGRIVREGEQVSNAVITEISADSIRYTYAGRDHAATLATRKLVVRTAAAFYEGKP
jgi:hypothetical protein